MAELDKALVQYISMIKKLDPELYDIKVALVDTSINPVVIPAIIRALSNIYYGTGHGKVQIFMQDGKITTVNPEERLKMDVPAVLNVEAV